MAPALQTIIALSFTASVMVDIIDLSLFPQLRFLRILITPEGFQNALDALSTITASSRMRTIIIIIPLPAAVDHELLDFTAVCSTEGANGKLLFWADFDPRDRIAHNSLSSARIELKHS
ncbi:hypothetical protein DFH09DRAFT_1369731 [Mycena vulgaris]|nr:hypothetical protein DFH09DRAFT_1369731 [Mycena vulgaris]